MLKKNGEVYFGTDVDNYFNEVLDFFLKKKDIYMIKNKKEFTKIPDYICETKYAKKALKKRSVPKYLVVKKK